MARFAVIVAAENYSDPMIDRTSYCHRDAELLRETLISKLDYLSKNVTLLLLSPGDGKGQQQIVKEIEQATSKAVRGDTVLFYFAGHGTVSEGEVFLILPDSEFADLAATALPLQAVDHILRRDGSLCIRILDACHSGVEPGRDGRSPKIDSRGFWAEVASNGANGWITFASCELGQKSYWDDAQRHGVFTHSLCEALSSFSTGTEIDAYALQPKLVAGVQAWCQDNNRTQTPTLLGLIPGKQVFAIRLKRPKKGRPPKEKTPTLVARLDALRSQSLPDNDSITDLGESLATKLREAVPGIQTYGGTIECKEDQSSNRVPEDLQKSIAIALEEKQLRAQFPWETYEAQVPVQNSSVFAGLAGFPDRTRTVTRIRFLPGDFKVPYIIADLTGSSPMPSATLFVVALPLIHRCYGICGYRIEECRAAGTKAAMRLRYYRIFDAEGFEEAAAQFIRSLVTAFDERYSEIAGNVVEYAERESSTT